MEKAKRPMTFGKLPVSSRAAAVPVIAVNKWKTIDGKLCKSYDFREVEQRNRFVSALLEHEASVGHHAVISIDELTVSLTVCTKDVDVVTELDKEYAAAADTTYKDVVYSRSDEGRKRE